MPLRVKDNTPLLAGLALLLSVSSAQAKDAETAAAASSPTNAPVASAVQLSDRQTYQDIYSFSLKPPVGYIMKKSYTLGMPDFLTWAPPNKPSGISLSISFRPKFLSQRELKPYVDGFVDSFSNSKKVSSTKQINGREFYAVEFTYKDGDSPGHGVGYGIKTDEGIYTLFALAYDSQGTYLDTARACLETFKVEPAQPSVRSLTNRDSHSIKAINFSVEPPVGYRTKYDEKDARLIIAASRLDGTESALSIRALSDPKDGKKTPAQLLKEMTKSAKTTSSPTNVVIDGRKFASVDFQLDEADDNRLCAEFVGIVDGQVFAALAEGKTKEDLDLAKMSVKTIKFEAAKKEAKVVLGARQVYSDGYSFSMRPPANYELKLMQGKVHEPDSLRWAKPGKRVGEEGSNLGLLFIPKVLTKDITLRDSMESIKKVIPDASEKSKGTKKIGGRDFATSELSYTLEGHPGSGYVYAIDCEDGRYVLFATAFHERKADLDAAVASLESFELQPKKAGAVISERRSYATKYGDLSLQTPDGFRQFANERNDMVFLVERPTNMEGFKVEDLDGTLNLIVIKGDKGPFPTLHEAVMKSQESSNAFVIQPEAQKIDVGGVEFQRSNLQRKFEKEMQDGYAYSGRLGDDFVIVLVYAKTKGRLNALASSVKTLKFDAKEGAASETSGSSSSSPKEEASGESSKNSTSK